MIKQFVRGKAAVFIDAGNVFYSQMGNAALACPRDARRRASGASSIVPRMVLHRTEFVSASIPQTRTATLADGGLSIVSRMMLRTRPVNASITNSTSVSSEKGSPVENRLLKPDRGIEPLGHRLTGSTLHHASGYRRFYHKMLVRMSLLNTRCLTVFDNKGRFNVLQNV